MSQLINPVCTFDCIMLAVHCAEKVVSAHLCMGSAQGAVHIMAVRLGCKGVAGPGCMTGLALTLQGFISGREDCLGSEQCSLAENTEYCMLVNQWVWLRSAYCGLYAERSLK